MHSIGLHLAAFIAGSAVTAALYHVGPLILGAVAIVFVFCGILCGGLPSDVRKPEL
jgi:hypothetical protein